MALSNASKPPVTARPSNWSNVGLCTLKYDATWRKSVRVFSKAPFLSIARASAYSPTLAKVCALFNSSSATFKRVCTAPPSIWSLVCFFCRAAKTASFAARAGKGDPTMTPETMMDDAQVPTKWKHADRRVVRVPSSPAAARAGTRAIGARSAVLELFSSSFARARVRGSARNERPSFGRRVGADRGRRGDGLRRIRATRPLAGGHAAAWRRLVGVNVNIAEVSASRTSGGPRARLWRRRRRTRRLVDGRGDVSLGRHRLCRNFRDFLLLGGRRSEHSARARRSDAGDASQHGSRIREPRRERGARAVPRVRGARRERLEAGARGMSSRDRGCARRRLLVAVHPGNARPAVDVAVATPVARDALFRARRRS